MKDAASLQLYAQGDRPEPLRVGVLLRRGCVLDESDSGLLSTLLSCRFIRIVQVITVSVPERRKFLRLFDPAHWLLEAYRTMDRSVLARESNRAVWRSDDVQLTVRSMNGQMTVEGAKDSVPAANETPDIDVLICLGMFGPVRDYCKLAKAGVWWVGPVEVPNQDMSTRHMLKVLATADAPHAEAVWSLSRADPEPWPGNVAVIRPISGLSLEKNHRVMMALRPGMLLASLWQLGARGPAGTPAVRSVVEAPGSGVLLRQKTSEPASPGVITSSIARLAFRHARHRLRGAAKPDMWNIGLRARTAQHSHDDPVGYRWLNLSLGKWHADPFLFRQVDRTWLFYEAIHELGAPAVIACAEVDSTGAIGPSQVVLQRPYHLSYPQVFTDAGEIYMIPETGTNGTVELYRAITFPDRWEFVRVLQKGPWFDTTFAVHESRFWFFSSLMQDKEFLTSQLVLFSSRQIDGDWDMHPQGPITFDSRYARGAGSIFETSGVKVRPAQDGSRAYGRNINFMRIDRWNEYEYSERPVWHLSPEGIEGASGVHTYGRTEDFEVIDRKLE